ncbi:hypothetical protein [Clostridium tunisiense]|uniref:hypothetical protein n=1 Tax=Clostridium tunisiense TaxID=219748 RepID=UPI0002F88491|nr:hypothetical protein [Clostridium tunisiense]
MPLSRNSKQNLEKSVGDMQNAQSFFTGDYEYLITDKKENKFQNQSNNLERNLGSNKK